MSQKEERAKILMDEKMNYLKRKLNLDNEKNSLKNDLTIEERKNMITKLENAKKELKF